MDEKWRADKEAGFGEEGDKEGDENRVEKEDVRKEETRE
jgi:hypothetical protein